jgi:hypothetical protein
VKNLKDTNSNQNFFPLQVEAMIMQESLTTGQPNSVFSFPVAFFCRE